MKLLLAFLLLLTVTVSAPLKAAGSSNVVTSTNEYQINNWMGPAAFANTLGSLIRYGYNTAYGLYDFSVQGGALGSQDLGLSLPLGAIIRNVFFDVVTQPVSLGSATVAFSAQSAGDLKAALAIASWTVGRIVGLPVHATVSTYIKLTAARTLTATIATAALTAGKIAVYVDYVQPTR